jgi:hypothetical protein
VATLSRYYVDRRIGVLARTAQETTEARLRADVDSARTRQDAAERELTELRSKVVPRRLADPTRLAAELRQGPVGAVTVRASSLDPEAMAFAREVVDVLRAAGWHVEFPERTMIVPAPTGVIIAVKSAAEAPKRAAYLQHVLRANEINAVGVANAELRADEVTLTIGQRP